MNETVSKLQNQCEEIERKMTDPKMLFELRKIAQADRNNYKRAAARWRRYSVLLAKLMKDFRKTTIMVANEMPVHHRRVSK